MLCKICGKDLFVNIDFRTLFKLNLKTHIDCDKYLEVERQIECFPIMEMIVEYNYMYTYELNLNREFIAFMTMGKILQNTLKETNWSIILWMSIFEFTLLPNTTQYLFWKLGRNEIKFMSLIRDM